MNVFENRNIDKTIVLGCGKSILDLTKEEIEYVNHCNVVIAMNKYMAFYKKIGIIPTHVYFVDDHENSRKFLEYIFDVCQNDGLEGMTFVVNKSLRSVLYASILDKFSLILKNTWRDFVNSFKLVCARHIFLTKRRYICILPSCQYQFISTTNWLEGGFWANSLSEKLFHFRCSLTTILNYCTIIAPQKDIFLLGNDFRGSEYFFEDELNALPFDWKDWTTDITKKENKHFSFVDYEKTNIVDVFPQILDYLEKNQTNLYCTNPNSMLVTNCNVKYKFLPVKEYYT